jgi:tetratricopeptide (TPR) repeat protein
MVRPAVAFACIVLGFGAPALADPKLEPKIEPPPPPRVREIAHRLFDEAVAATTEGKLDVAAAKYYELERLSPHPNITYNLALVLEAQGKLTAAIEAYDKYVAAAPTDARVAKHLAELRATPGQVKLEARTKYEVKALWYFDGDLVARDTSEVALAAGAHRIDMISELGYSSFREVVEPGHSRNRGNSISADADIRVDGNLVIDRGAGDRYGWFYKIDGSDRDDALGKGVHHSGRYTIAPGKHAIQIRDSTCDYDTTFVVGKDELVFMFFDRDGFDEKALLAERDRTRTSQWCGKLIVKRNVVKFDAKIPKR